MIITVEKFNSLILCNNDYSILLISPMELKPENPKNYIDQ
jgi:hypothetical protein